MILWGLCGNTAEQRHKRTKDDLEDELRGLKRRMGEIEFKHLRTMLPSVRQLTISSFYGSQDNPWGRYADEKLSNNMTLPDTWSVAGDFHIFLATGDLNLVCVHDTHGPLNLSTGPMRRSDNFDSNLHFLADTNTGSAIFSSDIMTLPLLYNRPSSWTFNGSFTAEWSYMIAAIAKRLTNRMSERARLFPTQHIDLTIHCSTSSIQGATFDARSMLISPSSDLSGNRTTISAFLQKSMSAKLETELRKLLPLTPAGDFKSMADRVRWLCSQDTPICAACGLGAPV